jgi:hypothetical protein
MTMTLVSTTTVSANVAAIDITSIPATGTDLLITFSARNTFGFYALGANITFNNSTSGYSTRKLWGNGSSPASESTSGSSSIEASRAAVVGDSATSNTFSNVSIYIPNYTGSTAKSVSIDAVTENNATSAGSMIFAGLWSGTSAITSVKFTSPEAGETFMQYTTVSVYTITKGSGGATVS